MIPGGNGFLPGLLAEPPLQGTMIPTLANSARGGIVRLIFIVFIGSGLGGAFRHLAGLASLRLLGPNFPYGTLAINILGSALMGLVVGVLAMREASSLELRVFLTTGLIGGFTTWSTFTLDAVTLWERGRVVAAVGYVLGSLLLSFAVIAAILIVLRRPG